ncbi:hypothetical protein [Pedobacter nyackensis]|uniref:Uncharacterized protein n=1 Tax=Pedobacter nyackensis TaxID=475255 RepID=A0A1W2CQ19_9SPHI|nr:hypothetical protein [Pedobacter nyackensis]SMC87330.1 hypothetical protein SAMN04488101_104197 [Pedobacter nyackensis]
MNYLKTGLVWLIILTGFHLNAQTRALGFAEALVGQLKGHVRVSMTRFNGTTPIKTNNFTSGSLKTDEGLWQLNVSQKPVLTGSEEVDIQAAFELKQGIATATAVAVSFDFAGWKRENYVLVPAIVYNGNRYRSIGNGYNPDYPIDMYYNPKVPLTISNEPRLSIEKGQSSVLELQTTNTATPSMCFFSPGEKKGFIVLTEQQTEVGNTGLTIAENKAQDSCSFTLNVPAMRKLAAGFGDFHKSGDLAPNWKAGDKVVLKMRVLVFDAKNIPDLLSKFFKVRKSLTGENQPRNQLPMSHYLNLATTICSNNFITVSTGSYYKPENNRDFQLGWVSGMMNTYPMLALNDAKERTRVAQELDFVVDKLQGKSGYFYGGIKETGEIMTEKANPQFPAVQAMVRKNSDVLLWLIKHLMLFKAQGHGGEINREWETAARKLAAAFTTTWKKHGEFGQYIVPETGEIAVFNSTAGAIAPGGLALAADYFKNPEWLKVAEAAADYYYKRDVFAQGLTGGDCGDISQDANSESAFGFLESLMALYHYTQDRKWLEKAEVQAALCATWTISYDPIFPQNSQIAKLGGKMAGAVWASIQNKHAAPGACTSSADYLFKLYRATGNKLYADLIRDIQHAHAEAVNVPPYHLTTNNLPGSSMERIQPSDAEGRASTGNFINTRNSWTETNGMLMALELPGIYLQTDRNKLVVFDHVEATILKSDEKGTVVRIKNSTRFDADVAVFAETFAKSKNPLSYTAFVKWPKVNVKAGEEISMHISELGKLSRIY